MRIAHLVQRFPVVSETFIMDQVAHLGGPVFSLAPGDFFDHELKPQYVLQRKAQVSPIRDEFWRKLDRLLKGQTTCPFLRDRAVDQLASALKQAKPALLLAHFGCMGILAYQLSKRTGIPYVIHFHGYDASVLLRQARYRKTLASALQSACGIVCVNPVQQSRLGQLCPESKGKILSIPYGVVLPDRVSSKDYGNVRRWLFVGRFVEKKKPDLVVEAFAKTRAYFPDATLRMLGDGPLLPAVEAALKNFGITDAVRLDGSVSRTQVLAALEQADAFVQHSVQATNGDEEGWPNSIAEAAAHALPIVATKHAAIPDQVPDQRCAVLTDPNAVDQVANAMLHMMDNPLRAKAMGLAARKRMAERFDRKHALASLERALNDWRLNAPTA